MGKNPQDYTDKYPAVVVVEVAASDGVTYVCWKVKEE